MDPEALEVYGGTYFRENLQKPSVVDLCFYTPFSRLQWGNWQILEPSGADHAVIGFSAQFQHIAPQKPKIRQLFNCKKANWELFRAKFLESTRGFNLNRNPKNPDELDSLAEEITSLVAKAAELAIPKLKTIERSKPWWNTDLKRLRAEKAALLRLARRQNPPDENLWKQWKTARNTFYRAVQTAKTDHWL